MQPAMKKLVPMIHVKDVSTSVEFYRKLGFAVHSDFIPTGTNEPVWAWLRSFESNLMVSRADRPVTGSDHTVLFYLYCNDVAATRAMLLIAGVAAGEIEYPFYAEQGMVRVEDPDGYGLFIIQA